MILSEFKSRILTSLILLFLTFLILQNQFILIYSILVFGVLSLLEFFRYVAIGYIPSLANLSNKLEPINPVAPITSIIY